MNNSKDKKFKRTEIGMIPSDWEEVNIGNINIEIQRGGSPRPIEKYLTNSIDGVNWIKIGDTNPSDKYINSTKEKITKEGAMHSREVHRGEFLLSNSMSYGRPYILNIDGYIHDGWLVLRHFEENFNVDYLYYCLSYDIVKKQYDNLASGSGVKNLNKDIIKKVIVAKPSKPEQKKIANALTRIDNLIEDYEKLIAKKEKIKQGLMQDLLTGKVRLKGFSDNWETFNFKQVFDVVSISNKKISTSEYKKNGKYPIIDQGQDIIVGYSDEDNKTIDLKEVIIFGDHTRVFKYVNYKFVVGADGVRVLTTKENYATRFIYYLLLMQEIPNTGYNRHFKFVKELSLKVPNYKEQQAISKVLSNADNEINDLKIKLTKIINIKKGMLDNLLTGKIRL